MYVMVSTTIDAAGGMPWDVRPDVPPSAYAVPITLTTAVTRTATNTAHHGVSGYIGFGLGGSKFGGGTTPEASIVYIGRVVLLTKNNNGEC